MNKKNLTISVALAAFSAAFASADPGAVYTLSNQAAGNSVLVFDRGADGKLLMSDSVPTGGLGTGSGLGNQNAVVFSENRRYLYAVNAGSNSLTVFDARGESLDLIEVEQIVGTRPISVTQHGDIVYVLYAGDASNPGGIRGYLQANDGTISPIPGANAPLSAASVGPAQVQFDPKGRFLVTTEKATNRLGVYSLDQNGIPTSWSFNASVGTTPFGFDFDSRGRIFVAEAFGGMPNASALSSYSIGASDSLNVLSGSAPTTETAACWTAVTKNGRFAYTTNAGSGSVSGYRIASDGTVTLLNVDGVTGTTGMGSAPIDVAISGDDRFLYVLGNGTHAIHSFRILADGQLEPIEMDGGLPVGTNGLAAR